MTFLADRFAWLRTVAPKLVDPVTGVFASISQDPIGPFDPAFSHFTGRLCRMQSLGWVGYTSPLQAASWGRERAVAKCIAKGLQYYCSSFYRASELPFCSAREAPFHCLVPSQLAPFSPAQREASKTPNTNDTQFTDLSRVRWASGHKLADGAQIYLPAGLVYFPYHPDDAILEVPVAPASATGLCFGRDWSEATLAGVCDVVQANALALTWLSGRSPPQIRVETLSDLGYNLVSRFESTGAEITLLDLSSELELPVVLACLRNRSHERPALVMGAGTDPDAEEAVVLALEELAVRRRLAQDIIGHGGVAQAAKPTLTNDSMLDLSFWSEHNNLASADFLFNSMKRVELHEMPGRMGADPERTLSELVDRLSVRGCEVVVHDLTTPDVRTLGVCVLRVVVPGIHAFFVQPERLVGSAPMADALTARSLCETVIPTVQRVFPIKFARRESGRDD